MGTAGIPWPPYQQARCVDSLVKNSKRYCLSFDRENLKKNSEKIPNPMLKTRSYFQNARLRCTLWQKWVSETCTKTCGGMG